jgi:predicted MPP superfamily phosphohydrolase
MNYQKPTAKIHILLVLFLLALTLQAYAQGNKSSSGELNFLVISDFGGQGGKIQRDVANQLGLEAAAIQSSFVITCGDNYHLNGIPDANDPRWKSEFEDIYSNPSLMVPWYASLGNHDYNGSPEAEIKYTQISKRWKMSSRFYSHTEKINDSCEVLFVHLDTNPFITAYRNSDSIYHVLGQDTQYQLHWLDSTLAHSRARWKIVIGHHPIYSSVENHGNTKELIDAVQPLLEKYGVQIYFCGHEHFLQYLVHGTVNYFVCGGGSTSRPVSTREDVKFGVGSPGFMSVTLTPGSARTIFINDKGEKLFPVVIN